MTTVKTAISIEKSLFDEIERLARKLHVSRSRFISKATQDFIRKYRGRQILDQINEAYSVPLDAEEVERLRRERSLHRRSAKGEW